MSARPTPSGAIAEGSRLSLNNAQFFLASAGVALIGSYGRQTAEGRTDVTDGHAAIRFIDELLRELHRMRSTLIGEIRADENERAVPVDRLLAEIRANRKTTEAAVDDRRPEVRA